MDSISTLPKPQPSPAPRRRTLLRWLKWACTLAVLGALLIGAINWWVWRTGHGLIVDPAAATPAEAIIVLGANVFPGGQPSPMLADRLDTAYALYRAGKAPKILVSGDHGQVTYDEVNAMRRYLAEKGVPAQDVFMDHAGFDTYSTMIRAAKVFSVHSAIVVTQGFHLPRALYLADRMQMTAQGVTSDPRPYLGADYYQVRELGARLKAFLDVQFHRQPRFLGDVIPITGDGRATQD